jgi:cyanophycinase
MTTIALVGGNEFRPADVDLDRHLLGLAPRSPARVLIVPTAAAHERPELAVRNGIRHYGSLGAAASGLMAIRRADWEEGRHDAAMDNPDLVYFTGGDPGYLLATVRETSLLGTILRRCAAGALLAGSSAGAMVLGGWMRERAGGWTPALGVVPRIAVLPHHRPGDPRDPAALRVGLAPDVTLLGIGEATGCVGGDGGRWEVVGKGEVRVIGPDAVRDYHDGDRFLLP